MNDTEKIYTLWIGDTDYDHDEEEEDEEEEC